MCFPEARLPVPRTPAPGVQGTEREAVSRSPANDLGRRFPADSPAERDARAPHDERLVIFVGLRHQPE